MHLDQERRQRLLHDELDPADARAAREHVARCVVCRTRLASEEREEAELLDMLAHLDHVTPQVTAAQVAAEARARGGGWTRWAAGLVLTLGAAGAAYALPGSPVRSWLDDLRAPAAAPPAAQSSAQPDEPGLPGGDVGPETDADASAAEPDPGVAGLVVDPGENLVIIFSTPQTAGELRVRLFDGDELEAIAQDGRVSFTSDVDRLVIDNAGSTRGIERFEIRIPRDAPRVEIRVGDRRVFLKDGPAMTSDAAADSDGVYTIPLSAGRGADQTSGRRT